MPTIWFMRLSTVAVGVAAFGVSFFPEYLMLSWLGLLLFAGLAYHDYRIAHPAGSSLEAEWQSSQATRSGSELRSRHKRGGATRMVADSGSMTLEQRQTILEREVLEYVRQGYRVLSQTSTTAQLVKPKVFSRLWAFIWFLGFGVGLIVYLLWYAAKRDKQVYLMIDEEGKVHRKS